MKIKSFIIDDELLGRKNLRFMLTNFFPEISIVGEFNCVQKSIKEIPSLMPDLIFLDIQMPELTGFDLIELSGERNFEFIFVTAHNEYGIEAVKAGALDYILKPVSVNELRAAVEKFKRKNSRNNNKINNTNRDQNFNIKIPQPHGFALIDSREIIRLEAENNYTRVFMLNGDQFFVCKTIKDVEIQLDPEVFLRVHKSSVINLSFFKEFVNIDGSCVIMKDETKIPVSRRKIQELKDAIHKFTIR
ncbi:MAG: response regulator transcription factor [Ignavibacteriae bacterium]|nr:response regulator transcription factor [Ignavibacteriota bacterium]